MTVLRLQLVNRDGSGAGVSAGERVRVVELTELVSAEVVHPCQSTSQGLEGPCAR